MGAGDRPMRKDRDLKQLRKQITEAIAEASDYPSTPAQEGRLQDLSVAQAALDWALGERHARDFREQVETEARALVHHARAAASVVATPDAPAAVEAEDLEPWLPPSRNPFQRLIDKLDALDWRIKAQLTVAFALAIIVPFLFLRDEVLALGDWGYLGAFIINGLSSATIILPAPGALVIALMAEQFDPLLIGIASGLGGALGGMTSYIAGAINVGKGADSRWFRSVRWLMTHAGILILFLFSAIPFLPGDFASIIAGSVRYPVLRYLIVTSIGNIIKMTAVAYLGIEGIEWLQEQAQQIINDNPFMN